MLVIAIDASSVINAFNDLGRPDQIPFAVSKALNMTAISIQDHVRARIKANFNLKRETYIMQSIKISKGDFAKKDKWSVTITVTDQNLAGFEDGTPHTPSNGRELLAAKAGKLTDTIVRGSNRLFIRNLGLNSLKRGTQGANGTFVMETRSGNLLIMQRTGKKASSRVPIYHMVQRITRPAKLHFVETANAVFNAEHQRIFTEAIKEVFSTMRPKR